MTPLHLDILLHYYTIRGDYEMVESNETRKAYAYDLVRERYLFMTKNGKTIYEITNNGRKIIDKILNVLETGL